jgi:hypothetical protein
LNAILATGRGSAQGNLAYWDAKELAASASQDYDLIGTLQTAFGDTVSFDRVKTIILKNTGVAGTNGDIRLIAQTFNSWCKDATDYVTVRAGGIFLLHAPDATAYDVTATTGDTIRLTNTSSTLPALYQIGFIGVETDSSSSESSSSDLSSSSLGHSSSSTAESNTSA